jgi:cell division protease FtsH
MVNEAAILAARKNKKTVNDSDFQNAIERIVLGPERKSRVINEAEQRITAYHEAGHAVVGYLLPNSDPLRKVTIIPRGMSGGSTLFMPENDLSYVTRARMKDQIVMALAGRAAEEIVFDEITTGASSDLEQVTKIARAMVTRFGMSEKLGPMMFGQKEEMIFLGREISEQRDYSEAVAEEIDSEVRGLVTWAYDEARRLIQENRDKLEAVAQRLLEIETLDTNDFLALMGETKTAPSDETPTPPSSNTRPKSEASDDNNDLKTLGTAPTPA